MPKKKSGGKSGQNEADFQCQAILLTDSYAPRFDPLTLENPKALLPVCGTPMINYSIQLLVQAEISDIFIVASTHCETIETYIENSKYSNRQLYPHLRIHFVNADDCTSFGDALRLLHGMNVIKSNPFVLMKADIVANMNLKHAIKLHRERYSDSVDNIMTCIFKKSSPEQRIRTLEEDIFIITNERSKNRTELLHYENKRENKTLDIDLDILENNDDISVYHNLCDTHIDICSLQALASFEDNFDYTSIRKEFFEGLLNSDISPYHIYAHIIDKDQYAARVKDMRTYHGVSMDIIERWTFPLVLDCNPVGPTFLSERNNVYKESKVRLRRSVIVDRNSSIGYGTEVSTGTHISNSVIGPNTNIGSNVIISNSHIFGDCTIGDNVIIQGSIIANHSQIKSGANVSNGCIVSYNVQIGTDIQLPPHTRVYLPSNARLESSDDWGTDMSPSHRATTIQQKSLGYESPSSTSIQKPSSHGATALGILDGSGYHSHDGLDEKDNDIDTSVVGFDGKGKAYDNFVYTESWIPPAMNCITATQKDRVSRGTTLHDHFQLIRPKIQAIETKGGEFGNSASPKMRMGVFGTLDSSPSWQGTTLDSHTIGGPPSPGGLLKKARQYDRTTFRKICPDIEQSIARAEVQDLPCDDVIQEIRILKLTHHAEMEEYCAAVFVGLLKQIDSNASGGALMKSIKKLLTKWRLLLQKYADKTAEFVKLIHGLELACKQAKLKHLFAKVLIVLQDDDDGFISNESVVEWYEDASNLIDSDPQIAFYVAESEKIYEFCKDELEESVEESVEDDDEDSDEES